MSRHTYKGNVVAAGPHVVKGVTRKRAWTKLHRRLARDYLNGDSTHASILPSDYIRRLQQIEDRGGLRLYVARRGWGLP